MKKLSHLTVQRYPGLENQRMWTPGFYSLWPLRNSGPVPEIGQAVASDSMYRYPGAAHPGYSYRGPAGRRGVWGQENRKEKHSFKL